MLVPLACFVHLLSLLMKLNTIQKIQLLSLSRTLAEESTFQFGLTRDRIFISKWQNTNFLFISKPIHTLPYSHLYLHSWISAACSTCLLCLNNSSTLWWPHSSAAWCHTFFKRHQKKWSNCENVHEKHNAVLNHFRQEVSEASVPSAVLCHAERILLAEHQIRM